MRTRIGMLVAAPVILMALMTSLPERLRAERREIVINGLTGQIVTSIAVARPLDEVFVKICPADLINYEYGIKESHEELKESFPIVGVGTVTQATGGDIAAGLTQLRSQLIALATTPADQNLLQEYLNLRGSIAAERTNIEQAAASVSNAAGSLLNPGMGCTQWPVQVEVLVKGAALPPTPSFFVTHATITANLGRLSQKQQELVTLLDDLNLLDVLNNVNRPSPDFRSEIRGDLLTLGAEIDSLREALDKALVIVSRWGRILTLHQAPVLEQRFLMPQTSARYKISLERKPITLLGRQELPSDVDVSKIAPSVIAATAFENRALHRFNVSLGMVGTLREDNKNFEIAPSVASDGTVNFRVRETRRDEWKADPAAFLGIYLGKAVDNFNPERRIAPMIMLGSEISGSPSSFFVGFGVDSPRGIVFGIGVTEYESTGPAPGWEDNQEIPPLGTGADAVKPKVTVVPTIKEDDLGYYAFLGFRPSIFRAFLDRRKP